MGMSEAVYVNLSLKMSHDTENVTQFERIWFEACETYSDACPTSGGFAKFSSDVLSGSAPDLILGNRVGSNRLIQGKENFSWAGCSWLPGVPVLSWLGWLASMTWPTGLLVG